MLCGHRYHGECIEKWLHMHGSCPMCRYNMAEEEGEGKKREEERKVEAGMLFGLGFHFREEIKEQGSPGDQRRSSAMAVFVSTGTV
ncbi:E3 ubiquitin-protein ligase RING1-like protein [Carex littledalei]|uniref:E3 ubiquitin-protein ligase RING1-like protein n=1 Tax=Carex littledalei TaxID=544730 RepID=A0A833QXX6_9POAL|nr:E3 ubiquitin-protein ligase RING1-like protein [Carex littledalei]